MSFKLQPGPVRMVFRAIAWILGPLLLGAGILMVALDLWGASAKGWPAWSRQAHSGIWLCFGNLVLGWMLLSAARTGRDPYGAGEQVGSGDDPRPQ
jgi:hypothetical protein